ncbi:hypothetical protein B0H16DRAFT_1466177 [Mycena metata]|uniref:Uncharacterized protein n=1 Tax=Mycena metata TaxID=1033252 RepID=A0AAD7MYF0_9AGAR|nr:hypothetical protein B0H16DRAFT_1466177 [Mycena metata]
MARFISLFYAVVAAVTAASVAAALKSPSVDFSGPELTVTGDLPTGCLTPPPMFDGSVSSVQIATGVKCTLWNEPECASVILTVLLIFYTFEPPLAIAAVSGHQWQHSSTKSGPKSTFAACWVRPHWATRPFRTLLILTGSCMSHKPPLAIGGQKAQPQKDSETSLPSPMQQQQTTDAAAPAARRGVPTPWTPRPPRAGCRGVSRDRARRGTPPSIIYIDVNSDNIFSIPSIRSFANLYWGFRNTAFMTRYHLCLYNTIMGLIDQIWHELHLTRSQALKMKWCPKTLKTVVFSEFDTWTVPRHARTDLVLGYPSGGTQLLYSAPYLPIIRFFGRNHIFWIYFHDPLTVYTPRYHLHSIFHHKSCGGEHVQKSAGGVELGDNIGFCPKKHSYGLGKDVPPIFNPNHTKSPPPTSGPQLCKANTSAASVGALAARPPYGRRQAVRHRRLKLTINADITPHFFSLQTTTTTSTTPRPTTTGSMPPRGPQSARPRPPLRPPAFAPARLCAHVSAASAPASTPPSPPQPPHTPVDPIPALSRPAPPSVALLACATTSPLALARPPSAAPLRPLTLPPPFCLRVQLPPAPFHPRPPCSTARPRHEARQAQSLPVAAAFSHSRHSRPVPPSLRSSSLTRPLPLRPTGSPRSARHPPTSARQPSPTTYPRPGDYATQSSRFLPPRYPLNAFFISIAMQE